MQKVLTEHGSSCLYHLFSFDTDKQYIGLVEQRPAIRRAMEHTKAICVGGPEAYYAGMQKTGGVEAWHFIPVVSCQGALPLRQLQKMENRMIGAHPNCWNKYHGPRVRKPKPIPSAKSVIRPRQKPLSVPPVRLESYFFDGDVWQLQCNIVILLLTYSACMIHSSRLHAIPTATLRVCQASVVWAVASGGSSSVFVGSLGRCIVWGKQLRDSWVCIFIRLRKSREFVRSVTYRNLEQIALAPRMEIVCGNLPVDQIYSLWWISRRICTEGIHRANHIVIRNELRSRGFMILPNQRVVLRVPPNARVSKLEIRRSVKTMLSNSLLQSIMVSAMMWNFSVVYAAQQTVGQLLDSTKQWEPGSEVHKCYCHKYPASWPRRHGHIFIPSWLYTGPFKDTIRSLACCVVNSSYSPSALRSAIASFWNRYFPSGLMGEFEVPQRREHSASSSSPLSHSMVMAALYFLRYLVIMGIDKCRQRKLLLCPALYDQYYRATFPVESDSVHFSMIPLSVKAYGKWLRKMFNQLQWYKIASWHSGSPPKPYPLFKLKDILASCDEVFRKKGKCCRNRPISPNTDHWLRRVYRRVGSVLRLVCLAIPSSSINLLRAPDLRQILLDWHSQGNGEWLVLTGDVANCYDELDHNRVLDGLQWALSQLCEWMGRRTLDRFSVNKYDRKDCTIGGDYTDNDKIVITVDEVMEVCKFDVRNSVMLVFGKLWRRLRGAPMGGFLSAFYAILCFAYIEHKCIAPMFVRLGLPGGIKRYLDDVLVATLCTSTDDKKHFVEFRQMIGGSNVYPDPLELNLEPRRIQAAAGTLYRLEHATSAIG